MPRSLRPVLLTVAASAALAAVPSGADAAAKLCSGSISFAGTSTKVRVVKGVGCAEARRVAKRYDKGQPGGGWTCVLTHAPFESVGSRIIGFKCAKGSARFQGLAPKPA